jgi:hypothetical protein
MNPGTAACSRLDSCHSERNKLESFLPRLLPHPMELGGLSRKPDGPVHEKSKGLPQPLASNTVRKLPREIEGENAKRPDYHFY